MEIIATLARWLQLVANLVLFGSCVFLAIAGRHRALFDSTWARRLERIFPWLAGAIFVGLVGILATTTGKATGIDANAWRPSAWLDVIRHTNMGHMWAVRAVGAVLLTGVVFFIYYVRARARWHYVVGAIVASLPLIASTLVSHSATDENYLFYVPVYTLHILLAGVWFGALPAFLLIIFDKQSHDPDGSQRKLNIDSLKIFSLVAFPAMLIIVLTGLIEVNLLVEDKYHTLVASLWGWSLDMKVTLLAIILVIAFQARSKWLPLFERARQPVNLPEQEEEGKQSNSPFSLFKLKTEPFSAEKQVAAHLTPGASGGVIAKMRKWIRIEFVLALLMILFATILSNSKPAKHTKVEDWPYPFRFSIDGTIGAGVWGIPSVQIFLSLGLILLVTAIGMVWLGRERGWGSRKKILVPAVLAISSLAMILPQFTVPAYPETYQNTPVPFDAISISNGSIHFKEYCSACHGLQGGGNGILAKTFTPPPADLLTEPHTARHTAGDFFHWVSYGIKNTGMPGFADNMEEDDRWDVVNYIHAMGRGYQARLLNPSIVPEKPSIGPPVFQFTTLEGYTGTLKDYRKKSNLLLVFFSLPDSMNRLEELSKDYDELQKMDTEILAIPLNERSEAESSGLVTKISVPIVRDGWFEIKNSYLLSRRTLTHPDLLGEGDTPDHMEFLIDRFGYLRARWIPDFDKSGWNNMATLTSQIKQLNQEGEILPPPLDHVH